MSSNRTHDRDAAKAGAGAAETGLDTALRLLRAVRRRLWLEAVAVGARRGAWVGAALTGLGATVHLALQAHAYTPVFFGAAIVLVASTLAAAASGRPAPTGAAAHADAWFAGRDLLSSTVDLLERRPSERPAAARFVLESAEQHSRAWLAALRPIRESLRVERFFAPCALLGVFFFMYGLPGALAQAPARGEPVATSPALVDSTTGRPADPSRDPTKLADDLRVWTQTAEPNAMAGSQSMVAATNSSGDLDPSRSLPIAPPMPGRGGAQTPVGRPKAGESKGTGSAPRVETAATASEPTPFLAVRFVELARRAGNPENAPRSGAGRELEGPSGVQEAEGEGQVPQIDTGSGSVRGRGALRPDLRTYVSEYERRLRELK